MLQTIRETSKAALKFQNVSFPFDCLAPCETIETQSDSKCRNLASNFARWKRRGTVQLKVHRDEAIAQIHRVLQGVENFRNRMYRSATVRERSCGSTIARQRLYRSSVYSLTGETVDEITFHRCKLYIPIVATDCNGRCYLTDASVTGNDRVDSGYALATLNFTVLR